MSSNCAALRDSNALLTVIRRPARSCISVKHFEGRIFYAHAGRSLSYLVLIGCADGVGCADCVAGDRMCGHKVLSCATSGHRTAHTIARGSCGSSFILRAVAAHCVGSALAIACRCRRNSLILVHGANAQGHALGVGRECCRSGLVGGIGVAEGDRHALTIAGGGWCLGLVLCGPAGELVGTLAVTAGSGSDRLILSVGFAQCVCAASTIARGRRRDHLILVRRTCCDW